MGEGEVGLGEGDGIGAGEGEGDGEGDGSGAGCGGIVGEGAGAWFTCAWAVLTAAWAPAEPRLTNATASRFVIVFERNSGLRIDIPSSIAAIGPCT